MNYLIAICSLFLVLFISRADAHPHGVDRPSRYVSPLSTTGSTQIARDRFVIGRPSKNELNISNNTTINTITSKNNKVSSLSHNGEPIVFGNAGNRSGSTVTMTGTVHPEGKATVAWFEWGTSPQNLRNATEGIFLDHQKAWQTYNTSITSSVVPFYFRSVAFNENGITRGGIITIGPDKKSSTLKVTNEFVTQKDNHKHNLNGNDIPIYEVYDISIEKEAMVSDYGMVSYSISITNKGEHDALDVIITDNLSFSVSPIMLSLSDSGIYNKKDQIILWHIPNIREFETRVLTYTLSTNEQNMRAIAGGKTIILRNGMSIGTELITIISSAGTYSYAYSNQFQDSGDSLTPLIKIERTSASLFSGITGTLMVWLGVILTILVSALAGLIIYEKSIFRVKSFETKN